MDLSMGRQCSQLETGYLSFYLRYWVVGMRHLIVDLSLWILDTRCWMIQITYLVLGMRYGIQYIGYKIPDTNIDRNVNVSISSKPV